MTTDIERELRELFRDKAEEAPVTPSTPTAAPPQVLRRGQLHQVGTVLGSAALVLALLVGSVAGLNAMLRGRDDPFVTGRKYEVFERTATVEAFTVTGPSDWYLANQWPLSMQIAVETSGGSSSACVAVPGNVEQECEETPGEVTSSPVPVPHGLPMLQLANEDLGLEFLACGRDLPSSMAVLYVAMDHERAIAGIADPSLVPFPPEPNLPPEGDGACGPGRYAHFTVNGEPFFAWIGLGSGVSDADRVTVETAYQTMSAIDDWGPARPLHATPAYVIAGGTLDDGGSWRLDLRPGEQNPEFFLEGVDPSLLGGESGHGQDTLVPSIPIEICCGWTDGTDDTVFLDVTFGFVRKGATGVELQVREGDDLTGQILPGTLVPVPPSLGSFGFDLFFIPGTAGLAGQVMALGLDEAPASTPPPAVAEPRTRVVELHDTWEGHAWSARFRGDFEDGTACLDVSIDGKEDPTGPSCRPRPVTSWAGDRPSVDAWVFHELYLGAGSVPSDIAGIRFRSDDASRPVVDGTCVSGPIGWTDHNVCAIALPPEDSGVFEYLDGNGTVIFDDEAASWGPSDASGASPVPVEPVHGGSYWAVYPWVGPEGAREANDVVAQLFQDHGVQAWQGELACDQGAADALGTDAPWGVAVYFETGADANTFARRAGLLGHDADPVIAHVTTFCLD